MLLSKNEAGELPSASLPAGGNFKEVLVAREQDAIQGCCPSQEDFVVHLPVPIVLRGDDMDFAGTEPVRDALRHVNIHVEP